MCHDITEARAVNNDVEVTNSAINIFLTILWQRRSPTLVGATFTSAALNVGPIALKDQRGLNTGGEGKRPEE